MKEAWKQLTQSKWFWITLIVISLILIFWIYNKVKGAAAAIQNTSEYNQLIASTGETPTLTPAQLDTMASTIYSALSEDWFNNFSDIQTSFNSLRNDADFLSLQVAFATRTWGIIDKDSYNLTQALHAFLSNDQINTLNSILAQADITYTI
jgi:hypothetical protein